MDTITRAIEFRRKFAIDHPEHNSEVRDLFQLMIDEIEDGESADHEVALFMESVHQLLE